MAETMTVTVTIPIETGDNFDVAFVGSRRLKHSKRWREVEGFYGYRLIFTLEDEPVGIVFRTRTNYIAKRNSDGQQFEHKTFSGVLKAAFDEEVSA
jgi:hypothetical protein